MSRDYRQRDAQRAVRMTRTSVASSLSRSAPPADEGPDQPLGSAG